MKKDKMKELVKSWNIEICSKQEEIGRLANKLKDLNEKYGDGSRYCSNEYNTQMVIKKCNNRFIIDKAIKLLSEINKIEGQKEALISFLEKTENFNL